MMRKLTQHINQCLKPCDSLKLQHCEKEGNLNRNISKTSGNLETLIMKMGENDANDNDNDNYNDAGQNWNGDIPSN